MRNVLLVFIIITYFTGCQHQYQFTQDANKAEGAIMQNNKIYALGLDEMITLDVLKQAVQDSDLIIEGKLDWTFLRDRYKGEIEILNLLKGHYKRNGVRYIADPELNLANDINGIWFIKRLNKECRLSTKCPGVRIEEKDRVLKIVEAIKF